MKETYNIDDIVTERVEGLKILPDTIRLSTSAIKGTRDYQQDRMMYETDGEQFLGAVCDGMGGLSGGGLASALAVQTLMDEFQEENMKLENPARFFIHSVSAMDRKVCAMAELDGTPISGGTTVVAVYLCGDQLYRLSVGDSKIYIFRDGKLTAITREHNYKMRLEQFLKEESMSLEEYQTEIQNGEALISYIGMGGVQLMDVNEKPFLLEDRDLIILCSDGLYKALSEEQIGNILEACNGQEEQAANILTQAVEQYVMGPVDNVTVMVIQYKKKCGME
ncbi:MAG: protein serine/threonine phosphatase 2C family protein [Clostridia bacterium]|nr:protein serine/threonine phosphatase 2C family protein [Clostridia bacterium]NCC42259.1 protein serine/threonine phosphatase 2C family protein [Clostridia bacterium]